LQRYKESTGLYERALAGLGEILLAGDPEITKREGDYEDMLGKTRAHKAQEDTENAEMLKEESTTEPKEASVGYGINVVRACSNASTSRYTNPCNSITILTPFFRTLPIWPQSTRRAP